MNIVVLGRLTRLLLLLVLALVLGGCRLSLGVDIDLAPDGGGTLVVSVTTDADLEQSAAAAGVDPLGRMADRVRSLEDGWRVRDEVDEADGSRLVELTSGFDDPAEFAQRYGQLTAALDAPEARLLGPLQITVDEEADTIAVAGSLAVILTELAAADAGTDVATLTEQLQGVVDSRLSVQTPGTPLQTDGAVTFEDPEATEGAATVTWTAAPGTEIDVNLVTERGGRDLVRLLLIVGGVALALLLILAGAWAQRRR